MGMTMAEKIIALAAGVESTKAGDIETVTLDRLMSNDGTTHLTIDMYNNLKHPKIADVDKLVWIIDHNIPADSTKTAASHQKMRNFVLSAGLLTTIFRLTAQRQQRLTRRCATLPRSTALRSMKERESVIR